MNCFHLAIISICIVISETRFREYYIGALDTDWDYAPSGVDNIHNSAKAADYLDRTASSIGHLYKKTVYRRFTDSTFTQQVPHPSWLGILGPTIVGETGDTLLVYFKNMASRPFTMHPHGVHYNKDGEGALYLDNTSGADKTDDSVAPGATYRYVWNVTATFGPFGGLLGARFGGDPDCTAWVYHSHIDSVRDIESGVIGTILTCKKGKLNSNDERVDGSIDRPLMFTIFDENKSWHINENIQKCLNPANCLSLRSAKDFDFEESNMMNSINGFVYGNLPAINLCEGQKVNWHMFGMGSEIDVHVIHFEGQTIVTRDHRYSTIGLYHADVRSATMIPRSVGKWLIKCPVTDHYESGMMGYILVQNCPGVSPGGGPTLSGTIRQYYIAAEEVMWDYGPDGVDNVTGLALNDANSMSARFFASSSTRVGGVYKKALYFEYTDGSFATKKVIPAEHEYLGFLGPIIRGEAGDTIKVLFKNMATIKYSIQAVGVVLSQADKGSHFNNDGVDAEVDPGAQHEYTWHIPMDAGPTADDPDCLANYYHSGVSPIRDFAAGLVGPLLVCRKNSLGSNNIPIGIDREFFLAIYISDENLSPYLSVNTASLSGLPQLLSDPEFKTSNMMYHLNGFCYSNIPGLSMCRGDKVMWYLLTLGTEIDKHPMMFEGNTVTHHHFRQHVSVVLPGLTRTLRMEPSNTGTWALDCIQTDHKPNGMRARYRVNTCGSSNGARPPPRRVNKFYIGIVEIDWDFAPNKTTAPGLTDPNSEIYRYVRTDNNYIGSVYKKAVFRQFTDASFTRQMNTPEHLGVLGPTLYVEVGEEVEVIVRNNAIREFDFFTQGLILNDPVYGKETDDYPKVAVGQTYTYKYRVTEKSGPGRDNLNCVPWIYYSHIDPAFDVSSGLMGTFIVCRSRVLNPKDRSRLDVDKEFVVYFHEINENLSWYYDANVARFTTGTNLPSDFFDSNQYEAMNGRIFNNLKGLNIKLYEMVSWQLIGFDPSIHTIHFHGQTIFHKTKKFHVADVVPVFPLTTFSVIMKATNPGVWLVHCHLHDHLKKGMTALYEISSAPTTISASWVTIPLIVSFYLKSY